MRVVSLVPSVTQTVAALGAADALVGVTDWCDDGAPPGAARVGGTKNPSVAKIVALRPDLVLANHEENRREDIEALRGAGVEVLLTYPRAVADVPPLIRRLGQAVEREVAAQRLAAEVEDAIAQLTVLPEPVPVLTLIWRKPWMAVGPGTYADDLLSRCGFANVLATDPDRYPVLQVEPRVRYLGRPVQVEIVVLPSEPYAFSQRDVPGVRELVGEGPAIELVDGRLLTWHGPRTIPALRTFSALAQKLASHR